MVIVIVFMNFGSVALASYHRTPLGELNPGVLAGIAINGSPYRCMAIPFLSPARWLGVYVKLAPNWTEETTYYGPFLLILVTVCLVVLWRRTEVRFQVAELHDPMRNERQRQAAQNADHPRRKIRAENIDRWRLVAEDLHCDRRNEKQHQADSDSF